MSDAIWTLVAEDPSTGEYVSWTFDIEAEYLKALAYAQEKRVTISRIRGLDFITSSDEFASWVDGDRLSDLNSPET